MMALVASCATVLAACENLGYQNGRRGQDWLAVLADSTSTPESRADAADALGHILEQQSDSRRIVHALVDALADSSDIVRRSAGHALVTGGVRSADATLGLTEALRDTAHADVRAQAATLIGQFGRAAVPTVPALVEATRDREARVRVAAVNALGRVVVVGDTGVGATLALLGDPAVDVRIAAAHTLVHVAPPKLSVPTLARGLSDPAPRVRAAAAEALGELTAGGGAAVAPLTRALDDPAATVRAAAAAALGALGPLARAALPRLADLATQDRDPGVLASARDAVASVRGESRPQEPLGERSKVELCQGSDNRGRGC